VAWDKRVDQRPQLTVRVAGNALDELVAGGANRIWKCLRLSGNQSPYDGKQIIDAETDGTLNRVFEFVAIRLGPIRRAGWMR
jgi:hypothetical protein